jgi:mevalonate kinase
MKAEAPGKLILSGEHSVVYGAPAIAVPVSKKVKVSFNHNGGDQLKVITDRLGETELSLQEISGIPALLDQNYSAFLNQNLPIARVLKSPFDLLSYTLIQHGFNSSGTLHISSDIPAGAGMGSSAAVICALIKLCGQITGKQITAEQLFQRVRYCERLQHGRGSAIDAATVTYAKPVKVEADKVTELSLALDKNWFIWNSGEPESTTGETVSEVRRQFGESAIWHDFSEVTNNLERALEAQNSDDILMLVRSNHALLEQIGVVPDRISNVIGQIERSGGAAKICGAGSVMGSAGGMVLVYLPDISPQQMQQSLKIQLEPLLLA